MRLAVVGHEIYLAPAYPKGESDKSYGIPTDSLAVRWARPESTFCMDHDGIPVGVRIRASSTPKGVVSWGAFRDPDFRGELDRDPQRFL